jgi:hypothetical protein
VNVDSETTAPKAGNDCLINDLYGLTPEEIKIVEGKA